MPLANKKAVVTGGSRGIGLAIAEALRLAGANVVVIARNRTEVEAEAARIGAKPLVLDVSEPGEVRNAAASFAGADILVNAAGVITPIGPIETVDPGAWLDLLKVNVFGTYLMTQACIPELAKNGSGSIINFVGGGEGAFPNFSAYAASKGAIARFTETAAAELKAKGIAVNAIAPGAVNTRMTEDMVTAGKAAGAQYQKALEQEANPDATPEKAVRLVLWLVSSASTGVTGKILSAQWDPYESFPEHIADIAESDVYTMRRVRPKDRGFTWDE
jgi:3-oxoacyl-[acyl-carrier protein] reductase